MANHMETRTTQLVWVHASLPLAPPCPPVTSTRGRANGRVGARVGDQADKEFCQMAAPTEERNDEAGMISDRSGILGNTSHGFREFP